MAAATALRINAEGIRVQSFEKGVLELSDVVVRHLEHFRYMAYRRLGNFADAEDAVQDALLSALAHIDQFKGQAKMSTWLTSIVINSVRMKLRRRSRVEITLDETGGEAKPLLAKIVSERGPGPEELCRRRELSERLVHAVSRLSPVLRRTYELRDLAGLTIEETAQLLGVPSGTVKARLARARFRLKEMVKKSMRRNCEATRITVADTTA